MGEFWSRMNSLTKTLPRTSELPLIADCDERLSQNPWSQAFQLTEGESQFEGPSTLVIKIMSVAVLALFLLSADGFPRKGFGP